MQCTREAIIFIFLCLGQFGAQGYFGNFEDFLGMGCKGRPRVVVWVKIFIRVLIYVSLLVLNMFQ